jgi:hypothetical protein
MLKLLVLLIGTISIVSCTQTKQEWEIQWAKHSGDLKKVTQLFKENKLVGRADVFKIPDSIYIKAPLEDIFFSHKDSLTDTSCTLTFYLDTINIPSTHRKRPSIIYTTNNRIINFYKEPPFEVVKIEDNWYFVNYFYW